MNSFLPGDICFATGPSLAINKLVEKVHLVILNKLAESSGCALRVFTFLKFTTENQTPRNFRDTLL